jgi:hypothetical protein
MPKRRGAGFPNDEEVEAMAAKLHATLGPAVVEALEAHGIDVRDQVRFQAVATRCMEAREARQLSLKEAAAGLRVPQYRLRAIEQVRVQDVVVDVLERYTELLGLGAWLRRWRTANPELAQRLAAHASLQRVSRPGPAATFDTVLRFTITLEHTEPPVWRSIEVPATYDFWGLHVAIQDAMGWLDCHLHEFAVRDPSTGQMTRLGIPDEDFPDERPTKPSWTVPVAPFFVEPGTTARYLYDFGDDWLHRLAFDGRAPRAPGATYPRCTGGARRCPPEDVGGVPGFEEFLATIADPRHPEHRTMLVWAGGSYDPADFDAGRVRFDDPAVRLRRAMR